MYYECKCIDFVLTGKAFGLKNLWHTVCTGTIFVIFTAQECPKNEKENLWLVFCEF